MYQSNQNTKKSYKKLLILPAAVIVLLASGFASYTVSAGVLKKRAVALNTELQTSQIKHVKELVAAQANNYTYEQESIAMYKSIIASKTIGESVNKSLASYDSAIKANKEACATEPLKTTPTLSTTSLGRLDTTDKDITNALRTITGSSTAYQDVFNCSGSYAVPVVTKWATKYLYVLTDLGIAYQSVNPSMLSSATTRVKTIDPSTLSDSDTTLLKNAYGEDATSFMAYGYSIVQALANTYNAKTLAQQTVAYKKFTDLTQTSAAENSKKFTARIKSEREDIAHRQVLVTTSRSSASQKLATSLGQQYNSAPWKYELLTTAINEYYVKTDSYPDASNTAGLIKLLSDEKIISSDQQFNGFNYTTSKDKDKLLSYKLSFTIDGKAIVIQGISAPKSETSASDTTGTAQLT